MKKKILGILGMGVIATSIFTAKPVQAYVQKDFVLALQPQKYWRTANTYDLQAPKDDNAVRHGAIKVDKIDGPSWYVEARALVRADVSQQYVCGESIDGPIKQGEGWRYNIKEWPNMVEGYNYFLALRVTDYYEDEWFNCYGTFTWF